MSRRGKSMEAESRWVVYRGQKGRNERGQCMTANRYKVSIWGGENVLKFKRRDNHTVNTLKTTELYTLKEWLLWYVNYISIKAVVKKCMNKWGSNYIHIIGIILIQCQFQEKGGLSWIIWIRNTANKRFRWVFLADLSLGVPSTFEICWIMAWGLLEALSFGNMSTGPSSPWNHWFV